MLMLMLMLAMAGAIGHFRCQALLNTLVMHLKRQEVLSQATWLASFGWAGTTCATGALIASLLLLSFEASGAGVMAGAVPIIILLWVMLHHCHFRQCGCAPRPAASRQPPQGGMRKLEAARRFPMGERQAQGPQLEKAERTAAQSTRRRGELRCLHASDRMVPVDLHSGRFSGQNVSAPCLILQAQDIGTCRDAEAELKHIAHHDSLSLLANRRRFAQMHLDLDRFKLINDTLGHAAGDQFLTIVAQRIRKQVQPGDTAGQRGGDEFAVLVESLIDVDDLLALVECLRRALAWPCPLAGTNINSSASIGITVSGVGCEAPGDVRRNADKTMYRAKAAGCACIDCFDALVRRGHAEPCPVPPVTFVPIAEDSALIGPLTACVLGRACVQRKTFQQLMPALCIQRLHGKVSGTDTCRRSFASLLADALLANGLAAQQLTLTITERTLTHRLDSAQQMMGRLREIGVGLSVDDFGAGYSSLSDLSTRSTLSITSLKLDQTLVQRLEGQSYHGNHTEVVRAVIALGGALGRTVVAEGMETPVQLTQLIALGCEFDHGYLLARPLTPAMACAMAQANSPGRWPERRGGGRPGTDSRSRAPSAGTCRYTALKQVGADD